MYFLDFESTSLGDMAFLLMRSRRDQIFIEKQVSK